MTRLFIAEKKIAGETLASFLSKKNNVSMAPSRHHIVVGNDVVAWVSGHILQQFEPEEYDKRFEDRSNFSILPIIPNEFKLKQSERAIGLIANLRKLIDDSDSICHFGDPDREGQLIVDEILDYLNNRKPVTRLWTSALNDAGLAKALSEIKSNSEFIGYRNSALARSHADWLYGINMSRSVTIAARKNGASSTFTVGRVQTPTLALVVNREEEILNFVEESYYRPWISLLTNPLFKAYLQFDQDDNRVNKDGILTNKNIAENCVRNAKLHGSAIVNDYKTTPKIENAPLPFSLSALQAHCSALFSFSGSMTLELAQSLYLLKVISYPRASCDFLPESQYHEAPTVISSLAKAALPTNIVSALRGAKLSIKSRAWNDKEQESHGHHAIAPVALDNPSIIDEMTPDQKKVYFEIVKRYLLQFWPQAQFLETSIELVITDDRYKVVGKRYLDEGWKKAFVLDSTQDQLEDENDKETNIVLPELKIGQVVQLESANFDSLITKPPKRFTEGTLLVAMKNIHKYVIDPVAKSRLKASAGIGTEATRAETIKGLIEKELMAVNKKELFPTEKGLKLIRVLPKMMTTPDMTAMWESFMDMLLIGKSSYSNFMREQETWLKQLVASSVKFFDGVTFTRDPNAPTQTETKFKCFECDNCLKLINYKNKTFFACNTCKINFQEKNGEPVAKERALASQFDCPICKKNKLIQRKRNDNKGVFWSCLGWKPEQKGCNATFNDNDGQPNFEDKKTVSEANRFNCPKCTKGHLVLITKKSPSSGKFWGCSDWKSGCDYKVDDSNGAPATQSKTNKTPINAGLNKFVGFIADRGSFSGRSNQKD